MEWEIERDGDKIKRVVTFQQRKDAERREKEAAEAENRKYQYSSSGSSSSGSGHTSTIDDQDVEAYYYDYRATSKTWMTPGTISRIMRMSGMINRRAADVLLLL